MLRESNSMSLTKILNDFIIYRGLKYTLFELIIRPASHRLNFDRHYPQRLSTLARHRLKIKAFLIASTFYVDHEPNC